MNRLLNRLDRVSQFRFLVENRFTHLMKLKHELNRQEFEQLLHQSLPRVRRYIERRLAAATVNEVIHANKYQVDGFISDLYIIAFNELHEVKDEKYFESWLIAKIDKLLDDAIEEDAIDDFFISHLDDFTPDEWDRMTDKFSSTVDDDQLYASDLEEWPYPRYIYTLADIATDEEHVQDMYTWLDDETIHRHIDLVAHRLPKRLRTTFTLFTCQHFTANEIAHIQQLSSEEVLANIEIAKTFIRRSLENRFVHQLVI